MSEVTAVHAYQFAGFTLDIDRESLSGPRGETDMRPKTFAVLRYLVENAGSLVLKDDLMREVWGRTVVTEASITQCLVEIRRLLDDSEHELIRTVRCRGYILEAEVWPLGQAEGANHPRPRSALAMAILVFGLGALVLGAVWVSYTPTSETQAEPYKPTSAATVHYERGLHLYDRRLPGDLEAAQQAFEEAIGVDSEFALAWAGLSAIQYLQLHQPDPPENTLELVVNHANRALALAPDNGTVLIRAARAAKVAGYRQRAAALTKRALQMAPDNPLVLSVSAAAALDERDYSRAVELQRRVVELLPTHVVQVENLGFFEWFNGDHAESINTFDQAEQLSGMTSDEVRRTKAMALLLNGDVEGGLAELEGMEDNLDRQVIFWLATRGNDDFELVSSLENSADTAERVMACALSAQFGQQERALACLESLRLLATQGSIPPDTNWWRVIDYLNMPLFQSVRGAPQFAQVCQELGYLYDQTLQKRFAGMSRQFAFSDSGF